MDWVVCPVNAVRASHSAVDLRTCTDATYVYEVVHRGVGRGVFENNCFEKIGCLNGLTVRHWCKEAVTNQSSALGMHRAVYVQTLRWLTLDM